MTKYIQQQIAEKRAQVWQLSQRGQYREALPLAIQLTDLTAKALGDNHPDYAQSLNNLAFLYSSTGDYAKAEPFYRQASEIWRTSLGEAHPYYLLC